MVKDFELVPHTADIKIRAYGATREQLFRHALRGMFHAIHPIAPACVWEHERLRCAALDRTRMVDVTSSDLDALLVDFLSDALYFSDVHNEAYLDVQIASLSDTRLEAVLQGVGIERFELEIKAVTYHDLHVEEKDGMWHVSIVFDI
jgi:SHS2 domain-containing protein